MKIEVWCDFTCPSCYVGKKTLEVALEQFGKDKCIQIEYKSFQINPTVASESPVKVMDLLQSRYQLSLGKIEELQQQIMKNAQAIGVTLELANLFHTNTYHAHRLVKFAEKVGREAEMIDCIFQKYLFERKDIGEKTVLLSSAKEIGLDIAEVEMILSFNKYEQAVFEDQYIATEMGIDGVPFFIFNNTYAVSGTQPLSVYTSVLQEIWQEDQACFQHKRSDSKRNFCVGNDCDN